MASKVPSIQRSFWWNSSIG